MNNLYEMFKKDENTELTIADDESKLRKWFRNLPWSLPVTVLGMTILLTGTSQLAAGENRGIGCMIAAGLILMFGFALRSKENKKKTEDNNNE